MFYAYAFNLRQPEIWSPPFGGTSLLQVSELEAVITKKTP